MNRSAHIGVFIATLAALSGCSSRPPASESKEAGIAVETIQGRAQVLGDQIGTGDAAQPQWTCRVPVGGPAALPPVLEDHP